MALGQTPTSADIAQGRALFNTSYNAANGDLRAMSAVALGVASGLEQSGIAQLANAALAATTDAAAGAAIGSLIPGVGTVVGGIIGAMIGFITGLLSQGPPSPLVDTRPGTPLKFVFPWSGPPESVALYGSQAGVGWIRPPACPSGGGGEGCNPTDNSALAAVAIVNWAEQARGAAAGLNPAPRVDASDHNFILVGNYLQGPDPAKAAIYRFLNWFDPVNEMGIGCEYSDNPPECFVDNARYGLAELAALNATSIEALHYMLSMAWLWRRGKMTDGVAVTDADEFMRVIGYIKGVVCVEAGGLYDKTSGTCLTSLISLHPGGSSTAASTSTAAKVAIGTGVVAGVGALGVYAYAHHEGLTFGNAAKQLWRKGTRRFKR